MKNDIVMYGLAALAVYVLFIRREKYEQSEKAIQKIFASG
jgi:hypothetical protein